MNIRRGGKIVCALSHRWFFRAHRTGQVSVNRNRVHAFGPSCASPPKPAKKGRSDQPVDDSVITTKLKALFVKDKDVSFRTIEVKTVNGVVHLGGTAKSKQESDKAVSMARDIQGVKSVKNDILVQ